MVTTLTVCLLLTAIDPNASAANIGEANVSSACGSDELTQSPEKEKRDEARMAWVWRIAAIVAVGQFLALLLSGKPVQAVMSIVPVFLTTAVAMYILLIL